MLIATQGNNERRCSGVHALVVTTVCNAAPRREDGFDGQIHKHPAPPEQRHVSIEYAFFS